MSLLVSIGGLEADPDNIHINLLMVLQGASIVGVNSQLDLPLNGSFNFLLPNTLDAQVVKAVPGADVRPQPHSADAVRAVFPHEAVWVYPVWPVLPHQACCHLHLPQPATVSKLDGGQCLAGFRAALSEDAAGRAALALVAEAHATLLWLLCDDQVWPWAWAW